MNTKDEMNLLVELQRLANRGVTIVLQNRESSPEEIIQACSVKDDSFSYMRDYIWTESGEICELRFDKVINN